MGFCQYVSAARGALVWCYPGMPRIRHQLPPLLYIVLCRPVERVTHMHGSTSRLYCFYRAQGRSHICMVALRREWLRSAQTRLREYPVRAYRHAMVAHEVERRGRCDAGRAGKGSSDTAENLGDLYACRIARGGRHIRPSRAGDTSYKDVGPWNEDDTGGIP